MRHLTFANKDFAAIYSMSKGQQHQIKEVAREKVKKLKLKPERKKHGIRFKESDLFTVGVSSDGKKTKRLIEHTVSVSDLLRYIENVEVVQDCKVSQEACLNLCKIYVLTA